MVGTMHYCSTKKKENRQAETNEPQCYLRKQNIYRVASTEALGTSSKGTFMYPSGQRDLISKQLNIKTLRQLEDKGPPFHISQQPKKTNSTIPTFQCSIKASQHCYNFASL